MKMREETKEMRINNGMGTGVEVGMQRMRMTMTMQPPPPTLQSSNLHSHNHADSDYSHPPERLLSTSRLVPLPDNNVNTNGDMNNDVDSDDDKNKLKGTNSNDTTTVHTRAQTRVRRNYRDGRNAILQDGRNNIRSQGQGGQTKIQTQEEQEGKDDDDVTHLDFDLHKQVKWMMNTMESWEKTDMNIKHYQENLHVLDANVGMDPDKDIPCVDADVLRVDAMAPSSMCTTKGNANANANANEIVYLQDVATGRFHRCAVTLLSENELRKENDDDDNNQNDDLNHEVRWERERKEVMNRLAYSSKKCLAFMSGTLAGAQLIIFTNDYDINNGDTMRNNNNSILMMDMSSYHSICFILTSACLAGVVMKLVRDLSKRTGMGGVGGGGDNNYGGVTGVNSNLNLDLVGCLLIGLYFTSLVLTLIVTRVEFCRQGGGGRLLDVSLSSLPLSSLKGLKLTNSISCLLAWIIVNFASVIY